MPVTIREIAEKAGVSRGTVDRVLNGRQRVKPEVREKVLAIAKELNYVPNMAAKALAYSKKPALFGVIMPPQEIRFFDDVRGGIETAAEELKNLGVRVEYRHVDSRSSEAAAAALRELVDAGAGGIMLAAADDEIIREGIDYAAGEGVPVVTFNTDVEGSKRLCFVGQDLYRSGQIAAGLMDRVLSSAQAQILVLTGNSRLHAHRSRVEGFQSGLQERSSGLRVVKVAEGFDRNEDTFSQVDLALSEYPGLAGIYVASGPIGAVLEAVRRHGREGAIRIVCNDLLPEVEQGLRDRTVDFTIVQNPRQQGYRPVRILHDLVFAGKRPEKEYFYTETHILISESL